MRVLGIFMFFLLAVTTASAFLVSVPESLVINGKSNELTISVFNDSNESLPLNLSFFAPAEFKVIKPDSVNANSFEEIKIEIQNNTELKNQKIVSSLNAFLGEKKERKEILLHFNPESADESINSAAEKNPGTGLATTIIISQQVLGILVDLFLVIILALLSLGFISRLMKRIY